MLNIFHFQFSFESVTFGVKFTVRTTFGVHCSQSMEKVSLPAFPAIASFIALSVLSQIVPERFEELFSPLSTAEE